MAEHRLDITRESCPMTFVRTRLALDRMSPDELLVVRLSGDEPRHNVTANATALGHLVLSDEAEGDDPSLRLIRIRKAGKAGALPHRSARG